MVKSGVNSRDMKTQGSVLVVCLGMLVVLALMAAAFISTVTLHRDTAKFNHRTALAELAVEAGKARAIKAIKNSIGDNTVLTGTWFTTQSGFTGTTVKDILVNIGIDDISTVADVNDLQDSTKTLPKWNVMAKYKPTDLQNAYISTIPADATCQLQYSFYVVDLSGCLLVNPDTTNNTRTDWDDHALAEVEFVNTGTLPDVAGMYAGGEWYSWEHIKAHDTDDFNGEMLLNLSPFGIDEAGAAWRININTVSRDLLKGIIAHALLTADPTNAVFTEAAKDTDAGELADEIILKRPISNIKTTIEGMETPTIKSVFSFTGVEDVDKEKVINGMLQGFDSSISSMDLDGDGTPEPPDAGQIPAVGKLIVEKSKFFRVIVRGQLWDTNSATAVAEKETEFVYFTDADNAGAAPYVIYQRWVP